MAEHSPDISVIVPTRNRAKMLIKTLLAYGEQELSPDKFEVIVVDDGSTDSTAREVSSIAKNRPNVRYLHQEEGGPAKARNLGIANARGELLLITGDDCVPSPPLLKEHKRSHEGKRSVAVLGHVDWHPDIIITPFMEYVGRTYQFTYRYIRQQRRSVHFGFFYTSNISLPKSLLEDGFFFDEEFPYAAWEDVELGYRLWKRGVRIVYNPRAVTFHCHEVDLKDYIRRQIRSGMAAARYFLKHPEAEDLLDVQGLVNPQSRIEFYDGALKYYYLCGLQMGLSNVGPEESRCAVPLEDRLERWSSELNRKLFEKFRSARAENEMLKAILGEQDWNIKRLREDMADSRRAWDGEREGLQRERNEERGRHAAVSDELNRIRSTIPYRLYRLVRRLIPMWKE